MPQSICPVCGCAIAVKPTGRRLGALVVCPACEARLRVSRVRPLVLSTKLDGDAFDGDGSARGEP